MPVTTHHPVPRSANGADRAARPNQHAHDALRAHSSTAAGLTENLSANGDTASDDQSSARRITRHLRPLIGVLALTAALWFSAAVVGGTPATIVFAGALAVTGATGSLFAIQRLTVAALER